MSKVLYLIGSLRNERIPALARAIRSSNPDIEVFDDWYAAGPEADDFWKTYEQARGSSYQEALEGHATRNVFAFDKRNLDRATHAMLVLPAGKSGHMEIMYAAYGVGAKTAILLDPEDVRWDVMYQFIPTILNNDEEINDWLKTSEQHPLGQSSQERSTTPTSQEQTYYPQLPYLVSPQSWDLELRNTQPTTGAGGLNTPGSSGRPFVTSSPSTTVKISTPKAGSRT